MNYERVGILGRKKYSEDEDALKVLNASFDDVWRAITVLWAVNLMALWIAKKSKGKCSS